MTGATKQERFLEITDNYSMFIERTGLILDPRDLSALGIRSDDIGTMFWEKSTGMLLEFCKNNRNYHIVTITRPGRFENSYIPRNNIYMLADGDGNPSLAFDMYEKVNPGLLMEEMLEKASGMHCSIDRCHKVK